MADMNAKFRALASAMDSLAAVSAEIADLVEGVTKVKLFPAVPLLTVVPSKRS